jgi:hypothetical protein
VDFVWERFRSMVWVVMPWRRGVRLGHPYHGGCAIRSKLDTLVAHGRTHPVQVQVHLLRDPLLFTILGFLATPGRVREGP